MQGYRKAAIACALVLAGGFAPASTALSQSADSVVRALQIGRGSRIGVTVQDIEDADSKDAKQTKAGVLVETVESGGPADRAGIKSGDTITEFDGEKVRSVRQFSRLVQETPTGRSVAVAVSRGGQRITLNVTTERSTFGDDFSMRLLDVPTARLTTPPTPPAAPRAPRPPAAIAPPIPFEGFSFSTSRRLGVRLETLDDQLAQYFGVKEGALVRSVETDSAAQKAGVKAGDVITGFNGRQIYEVSDVNRAIDRMDATDEFTLELVRDHKPLTLKGKLEPRTRTRGSTML
jgi:serine protease Do